MTPAEQFCRLSKREREVLALLVGANTHRQSAASLGITASTLWVHRRNIYSKLGLPFNRLQDNPQLRLWAKASGIDALSTEPACSG